MESRFLTNYTETTFLSTIQMNLRRCKSFAFSVSFIKKAGLVLWGCNLNCVKACS